MSAIACTQITDINTGMSCKFCDRKKKARGMCEAHYSRWLKLKRPGIWDGGAPIMNGKGRDKTMAPVGDDTEDYAEFIEAFWQHCKANGLNYRGEIMEGIRGRHLNFI